MDGCTSAKTRHPVGDMCLSSSYASGSVNAAKGWHTCVYLMGFLWSYQGGQDQQVMIFLSKVA